MARLKLIVELKTRDDKWQTHICNDFPAWGNDFVTLYKPGFKREMIASQTIVESKQYFSHGKKN